MRLSQPLYIFSSVSPLSVIYISASAAMVVTLRHQHQAAIQTHQQQNPEVVHLPNKSAPRCMHCMQIGLYDTQSQHPNIKYVHILGSPQGAPTSPDLQEALPLTHLLAPVGECKECIAAAIDSLEADDAAAASSVAAPEGDSDLGSRSFGPALQAVLRSALEPCPLACLVVPHGALSKGTPINQVHKDNFGGAGIAHHPPRSPARWSLSR